MNSSISTKTRLFVGACVAMAFVAAGCTTHKTVNEVQPTQTRVIEKERVIVEKPQTIVIQKEPARPDVVVVPR